MRVFIVWAIVTFTTVFIGTGFYGLNFGLLGLYLSPFLTAFVYMLDAIFRNMADDVRRNFRKWKVERLTKEELK
jgi:hypothetical protein